MRRSVGAGMILGMAAMLMMAAFSGCHSSAKTINATSNPAPGAHSPRTLSPALGQHEASSIDSNPNLTPGQKAAAKASLQQEYGGGIR